MTAPSKSPTGPTGTEGREHELKCTPRHFRAVLSGRKTVELRLDDRGFEVGDTLLLHEWGKPAGATSVSYTGRAVRVEVSHVLEGNGLRDGYVALSIRYPAPRPELRPSPVLLATTTHVPVGRPPAPVIPPRSRPGGTR